MKIKVKAVDMRPGDTLVATRRVVTRTPWCGVRTPPGKVTVELSDGIARHWGRNTIILVERAS